MNYLSISDLHIGDGSKRDPWGRSNDLIVNLYELIIPLIESIRANETILVLNGDILELWGYNRSEVFKSYVFNQLMDLVDMLVSKVYYCIGNHDDALLPKINDVYQYRKKFPDNMVFVDEYIEFTHGEIPVRFMHGNRFDKYNSEYTWVGRGATKAARLLGKINWRLESGAKRLVSRMGGNGRYSSDRISDQENYALRNGCCLVTGHTHRYRKDDSGLYHDSGTFLKGDFLEMEM